MDDRVASDGTITLHHSAFFYYCWFTVIYYPSACILVYDDRITASVACIRDNVNQSHSLSLAMNYSAYSRLFDYKITSRVERWPQYTILFAFVKVLFATSLYRVVTYSEQSDPQV